MQSKGPLVPEICMAGARIPLLHSCHHMGDRSVKQVHRDMDTCSDEYKVKSKQHSACIQAGWRVIRWLIPGNVLTGLRTGMQTTPKQLETGHGFTCVGWQKVPSQWQRSQ